MAYSHYDQRMHALRRYWLRLTFMNKRMHPASQNDVYSQIDIDLRIHIDSKSPVQP